tara:strand:+ start:563 stop:1429 length:867 start_codon:yes stop_codon:yes gene_type:complete
MMLLIDRSDIDRVVRVERNMTLSQVLHQIKDKKSFATYTVQAIAVLMGYDHAIHTGEYHIEKDRPTFAVIYDMLSGHVVLYRFDIIEGDTKYDIYNKLLKTDGIKLNVTVNAIAEGSLMPDSYYFPRGTTSSDIISVAHSAMQGYLDFAWHNRVSSVMWLSKEEALIVASLVEKESADSDERKVIAKVIENRLRKKMRLQIDASVIYGKKDVARVTYKMVRRKHPYNTYIYKGLPPTAICMPSRDAIFAALHPSGSDDTLYYVLQKNGKHHFSATLKEHRRAKARRKK